jgi:hypothetical protein
MLSNVFSKCFIALSILYCLLPIALSAPGSVCSNGVYRNLLFLSAYPPAESFCSARYPQPKVTVTVTAHRHRMRGTSELPTTTSTTSTTSTTTTSTTPTCTGTCAQWSSWENAAGAALSTFCSCIEHPQTVTVSSLNMPAGTLLTGRN